jgi:hypothetical protein
MVQAVGENHLRLFSVGGLERVGERLVVDEGLAEQEAAQHDEHHSQEADSGASLRWDLMYLSAGIPGGVGGPDLGPGCGSRGGSDAASGRGPHGDR